MWTAHIDVAGLEYPPSGSDNSLSTGAIYYLTAGADGTVWALFREQLPEWNNP